MEQTPNLGSVECHHPLLVAPASTRTLSGATVSRRRSPRRNCLTCSLEEPWVVVVGVSEDRVSNSSSHTVRLGGSQCLFSVYNLVWWPSHDVYDRWNSETSRAAAATATTACWRHSSSSGPTGTYPDLVFSLHSFRVTQSLHHATDARTTFCIHTISTIQYRTDNRTSWNKISR